MKKKLFWFPLLASLLSIAILYTIGNIFEISLLQWSYYQDISSDGFSFEVGASFVPVLIGSFIGFITERILRHRYKSSSI